MSDPINWFLDFFTGDSQHTAQAIKSSDGDMRTLVQKEMPGCVWEDTAPVRQHLTRPELRIYNDVSNAINSGANTVNIGGHSFSGVPGPNAPLEQQAAFAKVVYNTVNNTNIEDNDVNNVLNQTAYGGSNYASVDQTTASGDGAVAAGGDIRDSAIATGGSVAGAGGADVVGATGDGASAAQADGGGQAVSQAGGGGDVNQVDDSNLAGVSFGSSGDTVGAAPGGVAAGGDAAQADDGSTIGQGGAVTAGQQGTVGTAATTGGAVDQSVSVDASVDASNTNQQIAGGDIDQSDDDIAVVQQDNDVAVEQSIETEENWTA